MGVALITPFNKDDSIDFDALGRLVDYQLRNKTDYLVVLGTTAETPTLSDDEKKAVKDFVIQRVNGHITYRVRGWWQLYPQSGAAVGNLRF